MRVRRALLGLVVVGLVVAGLAWRGGERGGASPRGEAPDVVAGDPAGDAEGEGAEADAVADPDAALRPRSLRGTRVDGGLVVDAAGHFVPTLETRRFFDYFLTATGEIAPDALRAQIVTAIGRRLPPSEAPAAVALLDRYLDYRDRARAMADAGTASDDLAARLQQVERLRREVFPPDVVEAFFAEEEAAVHREIARRAVAGDPSLSFAERQQGLAAIDADAPPEVREARAAAVLAGTLQQEEAALHARGGSPDELRALRERLVGPEAASRLADLDTRRADWQARVDEFRSERARIVADQSRTQAERATAVSALLASRFSEPERLRVQALDEIPATGPR